MRTLTDLIKSNDTVWIYCRNDELADRFLKQCEAEGFLTLTNETATTLFRHQLYGISSDMTMGYLPSMVWSLTKQKEDDDHVRIDYEKYIQNC